MNAVVQITATSVRMTALRQRLTAAAETLGVPVDLQVAAPDGQPVPESTVCGCLLSQLAEHLSADSAPRAAWLTLVALAGAFPDADQVQEVRRVADHQPASEIFEHLLAVAEQVDAAHGLPLATLRIVTGTVVVDVHQCASSSFHTGIQRVVREVLPRWLDKPIQPVVWTPKFGAMRGLTEVEEDRVFRFVHGAEGVDLHENNAPELVVPWETLVFLPESLIGGQTDRLLSMARFSGNRFAAIGYDTIPLVMADLHPTNPEFGRYLAVIRHIDRVVAISESAATEFRGFAAMVRQQGLPGPDVRACSIPVDLPAARGGGREPVEKRPGVLLVGRRMQHKNHMAVVFAAETLWREGLDFSLRIIGGPGWEPTEFEGWVERLLAAGRPLTVEGGVDDEGLLRAYRESRFSVFPSLHEGYGLPVAESLASGTPVITTNYGSTAEIAAGGGTLTVDPRDDDQLIDAMRRLLTDDALLARLEAEAANRAPRTWDDYARDLERHLEDLR